MVAPSASASGTILGQHSRPLRDNSGVTRDTANAIVDENSSAQLDALRAAVAVLALVGLTGWISRRIPTQQPGSIPDQTERQEVCCGSGLLLAAPWSSLRARDRRQPPPSGWRILCDAEIEAGRMAAARRPSSAALGQVIRAT
jgi:hypothetical protein